MSNLRVCFLFLCFLVAGLSTPATAWKTFKSTKYRFSVLYPASWYRLDHTIDSLDIINFPPSRRVKGVVLSKSGASISVVSTVAVSGRKAITTIPEWITADLSNYKLLNRRQVGPLSQESGACTQLVETEWEEEEGPSTYTHETSYYCATDTGLYRVLLSNWHGDPKQEQLQATALKIASSLRSW